MSRDEVLLLSELLVRIYWSLVGYDTATLSNYVGAVTENSESLLDSLTSWSKL